MFKALRQSFRTTLLLGGLVLGMTVLPCEAFAQYSCPPGTELETTEVMQLGENSSILASIAGIFTFMQTIFTEQILSAISANTSANVTAQNVSIDGRRQLTDLELAQQWTLAKAKTQGDAAAKTQPPVGACQVTTGTRALVATREAGPALLSSAEQGRISDADNLSGTSSVHGKFAQSVVAYQYRQQNYAKCDEEGYPGCVDGKLPNADTRPRIIFGYDTFFPNPPQVAQNIQPTDLESAAFDYCTNLLETLNQNNLQNDALQSPQGIAAHMLRKSADARMQLAQYVCDEMVVDRAPLVSNSGSTDATTNINSSPCNGTSNTAGDNTLCWGQQELREIGYPNGTIPRILSKHQLMKVLYDDEFAGPNWNASLASNAGTTQQLKMLIHLTALRLQMQWENYQQLEKILMMESVNNASQVEKMRPEVSVSGTH